MKNNVIEAVFEANDIDVPDAMVESEIDSMLNEFDQQLRAQGMDLNGYLNYMGQDAGKFRDTVREDAFKRTKTRMIVAKIVDQENFQVSEEEVKAQLEAMAQQYGLEVEKLTEMIGAENINMISGDLKMKKAVDFMYENAVIK